MVFVRHRRSALLRVGLATGASLCGGVAIASVDRVEMELSSGWDGTGPYHIALAQLIEANIRSEAVSTGERWFEWFDMRAFLIREIASLQGLRGSLRSLERRAQEWLVERREARLGSNAEPLPSLDLADAPPGFQETRLALLDIDGAEAISEMVGGILIRMLPVSRSGGPGPQALRLAIDAASGGFRGPAEEIDTFSAFGTALWRVESLLATADTAQLTALAAECRRWAQEDPGHVSPRAPSKFGALAAADQASPEAGHAPPRDVEKLLERSTRALLLRSTLAPSGNGSGSVGALAAQTVSRNSADVETSASQVVGPRADLEAVLRARGRGDRSGELADRMALADRMTGWAGLGASGAGAACAAPRSLDPLAVVRAAIDAVPIAGSISGSSSGADSIARQVRHTAVSLAEGSRRDASAALAERAWPEAAAALAEAERLGRPARDPALVPRLASLRLSATTAYVDELALSAAAPALVDAPGAALAAARRASRAARRAGDPAAEVHALLEAARVSIKRPGAGDAAGLSAARRASADSAMLAARVRVAAAGAAAAPAPAEGEADDIDEAIGTTFLPIKEESRGDAAAVRARYRAMDLASARCGLLAGAGAELLLAAAWHNAGYASLAAAHARAAASTASESGDAASISIARMQLEALHASASGLAGEEGVEDPRDSFDLAEAAADRAAAVGDAEGSAAGLCAAAHAALCTGASSTALPCALAAERLAQAAGIGGRLGEAKLRSAQSLFELSGLSAAPGGESPEGLPLGASSQSLLAVPAAAAQVAAFESGLRLSVAGKAALAEQARQTWRDATVALSS